MSSRTEDASTSKLQALKQLNLAIESFQRDVRTFVDNNFNADDFTESATCAAQWLDALSGRLLDVSFLSP